MTKDEIRNRLTTLVRAAKNESFDPLAETAVIDLGTMVISNIHAIALSLVQIANPVKIIHQGALFTATGDPAQPPSPGLTPRADGSD